MQASYTFHNFFGFGKHVSVSLKIKVWSREGKLLKLLHSHQDLTVRTLEKDPMEVVECALARYDDLITLAEREGLWDLARQLGVMRMRNREEIMYYKRVDDDQKLANCIKRFMFLNDDAFACLL